VTRSLPELLRLVVITDGRWAGSRGVEATVREALEAGAPCVQLREKSLGTGEVLPLAVRLRELTREHEALLIVNDRVDLALACRADGVHLGPDDLPVSEVRRIVPSRFLIGFSTDEPHTARQAEAAGADYLGCGTVWPTESKADAGRAIGPEGVAAVARAVRIPVVGIGGVTPDRAGLLREIGAAGVAVIRAVMEAPDPGATVRRFLEAWDRAQP
jgi:thiamine-phosphate pyrophosphorylase